MSGILKVIISIYGIFANYRYRADYFLRMIMLPVQMIPTLIISFLKLLPPIFAKELLK